jgi:DNA polymerase sigma
MLILKKLLQITNLNNTFTGGMSSFSLFLLILAFINIYNKREITEETIGRDNHLPFLGNILIEMLDFYGNIFSFENFVVNAGDETQPIISIDTLEKNNIQ